MSYQIYQPTKASESIPKQIAQPVLNPQEYISGNLNETRQHGNHGIQVEQQQQNLKNEKNQSHLPDQAHDRVVQQQSSDPPERHSERQVPGNGLRGLQESE